MYGLLIYSLKVGVCLAVFYLFFKLLLSRETFHRFNRIVVLGAMVLSFVLPLCVITVYRELPLPPPQPELLTTEAAAETAQEPLPAPFEWESVAGAAFLVGAVVTLLWTVCSLVGVLRLIRSGRRERLEDRTVLVRTERSVMPFSWGRYIVMSEKEQAESRAAILLHERAHLRLRHSLDLIVTDVAGCLQWFNPAMWLLRRELRAIHEYEADAAVLDSGVDARSYQLLLIRKAAGGRWYSVANSFNHSKLKNRITMMLSKKSSRWAGARALLLLPLTGLALGAFAQTAYVYPEDKGTKENVTIRVDGRKISPDGRKPLILADGREVASMDSLDASRIESILVLKDSAAVTAYGERGRAGVILVTMKKPGDAASKGAGSARLDEVRVVGFGTLPSEGLVTIDSLQRIHISAERAKAANGRVLSVTATDSAGRGRGKTSKSFRWSPGAKSSQSVAYTINGTRVSQADIESIDPNWIESISIVENDGEKSAADTAATDVRVLKVTTKSPGTIAKEGMNRAAKSMEAALKGLKGNRALSPEELEEARRALETTKKALDEAQKELDAAEKETSAQVAKIQSIQAVAFGTEDGISVQGSTGNVASFSWNQSRLNSALSGKKLIYINGVKVSKGAARRLDPEKILHVRSYKGDSAVQRFGEKGRDGVVDIRVRK